MPVATRQLAVLTQEDNTMDDALMELHHAVRKRVVLPDRPIFQHSNKRARRLASAYADTYKHEVRFVDLRIRDVCLMLCPEADSGSEKAFRIKVQQNKYSPWLYLAQVVAIEQSPPKVEWQYLVSLGFTQKADKYMAKGKAAMKNSWYKARRNNKLEEWSKDEMILGWQQESEKKKEKGGGKKKEPVPDFECIPLKQYSDAVNVILAVDHLQQSEEDEE
jgi:hypothetical protein